MLMAEEKVQEKLILYKYLRIYVLIIITSRICIYYYMMINMKNYWFVNCKCQENFKRIN